MKFTKDLILKNDKKCIIRNAAGDDAQEVLKIFLLTHEQTDFLASYKDETTFDEKFEEQFLIEKENSDKEVYLCAIVDGCIVGTAGLNRKGHNKIRHRAEFGMAIEKNFWRLGIGRALAMSCIECAKNAGYSQLELEVVGENRNAISLYKSIGFVEFGRNPRGFVSWHKGWQELVLMRLELN
ncbi:TPA: GNAT family N-acetyltransferase [Streptococcus suis 92-1400]|uniref:GNAT family N-acetyltransferase n=1 Tax=Streptococcus suis TaxID=1307 RepID=UPI000407F074|nr:GNAT family N-acetyltransferase [Streptococcus suis]HEM3167700.1 GNAT family N-acetyltransferase [Streptococcus suis 92-1400]HEM6006937.1 GNAT family N-acetyltransferase [Streptococcus suis]HEM6386019.1 GNAT family N-acetyltransferase [Streptococcus suis]